MPHPNNQADVAQCQFPSTGRCAGNCRSSNVSVLVEPCRGLPGGALPPINPNGRSLLGNGGQPQSEAGTGLGVLVEETVDVGRGRQDQDQHMAMAPERREKRRLRLAQLQQRLRSRSGTAALVRNGGGGGDAPCRAPTRGSVGWVIRSP